MRAKTYPTWVFDTSEIPDPLGYGERAVKFFRACRHPLSTAEDKSFALPPFWERIMRRIYGPRHPDGRRIVRTVFAFIARGARKTSVCGGGLGLLHAIGPERVSKGQVLLAAGSADQAELAFTEARNIVQATPLFRDGDDKRAPVKVRGDYLEHPVDGSRLKVLANDGDLALGTSPDCLLLDEIVAWKNHNRRLWTSLRTGMVKRPGSLMVITTTAGRGQTGIGWDEYCYAKAVALGQIENPSYLPIIFEPGEGADWQKESLWREVCPGLRYGFPVLEEMRAEAAQVKDRPPDLDDFKTYNLNFWSENTTSPYVDMAQYDACDNGEPIDFDALKSVACFCAVDASSSVDLTIIIQCWRVGSDYIVKPHFFCPTDNLEDRERLSGAHYQQWARDGFITATEGNVVDFDAVLDRLETICREFDVREVAFDPHLARMLMSEAQKRGINAVEHRQGSASMMAPYAELQRAVIAGRLIHGGHPVLRHNFACAEAETNDLGHVKGLRKSKKFLSIDGCVASAMAVYRCFLAEDTKPKLFINDPAAIAKMYGLDLEKIGV